MSERVDEERPVLLWAPQILDPEDRGQMERFASFYDQAWRGIRDRNPERVGTPNYEIYAEMFRLFKDPNRRAEVPEPPGFGAVVEDYDGFLWVRVNVTHWHSEASPNNRQTWGELTPRRILAIGVDFPESPTSDRVARRVEGGGL